MQFCTLADVLKKLAKSSFFGCQTLTAARALQNEGKKYSVSVANSSTQFLTYYEEQRICDFHFDTIWLQRDAVGKRKPKKFTKVVVRFYN